MPEDNSSLDTRLEQDLRQAFRREPAPEGFAERVIALAGAGPGTRTGRPVASPFWRRPLALAVAAAVFAAAAVPPALFQYRKHREAEAAEARRELLVALSVTRVKLQQARERIQRIQKHAL